MLSASWLFQYSAIVTNNNCICTDEQRRLALICVVDFAAVYLLYLRSGSLKDVVESPKVVREVFGKLRGYYLYVLEAELGKQLLSSRRCGSQDDTFPSQFVQGR